MSAPVPGRGAFRAGAIGLLLWGLLHLVAVYDANFNEPILPGQASLQHAMKDLKIAMGPFESSAWSTTQILNASYSVLLLQAGVLSLVAMGPAIRAGRLRLTAVVNMLFSIALLIISSVFQFPPPMVMAGAVAILFGISLVRHPGTGRG